MKQCPRCNGCKYERKDEYIDYLNTCELCKGIGLINDVDIECAENKWF